MSRRTRSFLFNNVSGRLLTDVSLTLKQISDEVEGSESVNVIATNADVKNALSVVDAGGDGSLAYNSSTGVVTYTGASASEVRAHFSASTGISITDGAISTSITQYTDALARSAISVTDSGGDGSLAYNSSTGVLTFTGPSASNVRAHFSAGTGIAISDGAISTSITQYTDALARSSISVTDSGGDGSLAYDSTTGVITYTGPSASDVRAHFSAGTGIAITNGSVAVDSTIATKTYADNAATTAVANVIDTAPSTLNTLNELAAALGNDVNFATTITTSIGTKLNSSAVSAFGLTLVDDADAATARTTLGLGNVTNESKATMFSSPTFTGTVSGVTATHVGLGNVTNESKATMFSSPTFTGTAVLPSTTSIGDVSSTELGYLDGVTSAIQTQLDAKAALAGPTFTGTVTLPSTTSVGNVSSTELGYLDGVTSAIQTQINSKASTGKAIAMAIVFGG
jgi:hypothetical protein